jgi:hypothetical protein
MPDSSMSGWGNSGPRDCNLTPKSVTTVGMVMLYALLTNR